MVASHPIKRFMHDIYQSAEHDVWVTIEPCIRWFGCKVVEPSSWLNKKKPPLGCGSPWCIWTMIGSEAFSRWDGRQLVSLFRQERCVCSVPADASLMLQMHNSNFIFSTIEMKVPFKYRGFVVHVSLDAWASSMYGYARGFALRLGIRITLVQTLHPPNRSSNLA